MNFKETEYGDLTNKTYETSIDISNKQITSLDGSPKEIRGTFNCSNNNLISLKGSPKIIYGSFSCEFNKLQSLKGSPKEIGFYFNCKNNPELKNIKQQIIENQIKAGKYSTDDGNFNFKDIKKEFLEYGQKLKKLQIIIDKKKKLKDLNIIKNNDYGLGI